VDQKTDEKKKSLSRRKILQTGGFAATTALTLSQISGAAVAKQDELDSISYVEVQIKYRGNSATDLQGSNNDSIADFVVNTQRGSLRYHELTTESVKKKLKNEETLVKGVRYRAAPCVTHKGVSTDWISVGNNKKMKTSKSINYPPVRIKNNNNSIIASHKSSKKEVDSNSIEVFELPDRTFTIIEKKPTEIMDERIGEKRTVYRYESNNEYTFKPQIMVKNFGELDIVDNEEIKVNKENSKGGE